MAQPAPEQVFNKPKVRLHPRGPEEEEEEAKEARFLPDLRLLIRPDWKYMKSSPGRGA